MDTAFGRVPFGRAGHHDPGPPLESYAQPERFERRVRQLMKETARDRTWCRQRCAETWPDEHQDFLRAKSREAACGGPLLAL